MRRIFNARCKLNLAEFTAARKLATNGSCTISEMLRGLIRSASKATGDWDKIVEQAEEELAKKSIAARF